jgi:putative spermidine/putrescine transport system permease protein
MSNDDTIGSGMIAKRLWLYLYCGAVMLFLIVPVLIVIPISFSDSANLRFPPSGWSLRWYENYLSSPDWMSATWISVKAAVLTTVVATPLGVAAAYGLQVAAARVSRALYMIIMLPLLLPVIIMAIGMFFTYAKIDLLNTTVGLVAAHTVLAIPFVMVTVAAALKQYDMTQENAARSLGCNRLSAFFFVTLPQIKTSVYSGALLAFITSLDEVVIAIFISTGDRSTLTRRMFSSLRDQIEPTVAAISSLLIVASILLFAGAQLLGGRNRQSQSK